MTHPNKAGCFEHPNQVGCFDIRNFKTTATRDRHGGTADISEAFTYWLADEAVKTQLTSEQIAHAVYKATCEFHEVLSYDAYPFYDPNAKY